MTARGGRRGKTDRRVGQGEDWEQQKKGNSPKTEVNSAANKMGDSNRRDETGNRAAILSRIYVTQQTQISIRKDRGISVPYGRITTWSPGDDGGGCARIGGGARSRPGSGDMIMGMQRSPLGDADMKRM